MVVLVVCQEMHHCFLIWLSLGSYTLHQQIGTTDTITEMPVEQPRFSGLQMVYNVPAGKAEPEYQTSITLNLHHSSDPISYYPEELGKIVTTQQKADSTYDMYEQPRDVLVDRH